MKEEKNEFYKLKRIDKEKAMYNLIIGERSNGKSFACLERIIDRYVKHKEEGAIIRRWSEDYKKKRGDNMWSALSNEGVILSLTNGEWDRVRMIGKKFYFAKLEDNRLIMDDEAFCHAFALTDTEHDKSTSYPNVTTIVFDEFLTRELELPDEFVLFMNTISTIIRHRDNVTVYMLGNTVSKNSIYFKEMGITNIAKMKPGDISIYTYGDSELKVAVEYCNSPNKNGKKSDKYFAFNNPKLRMITGGDWELAIYPHLPDKYKPKEVYFVFFIKYEDIILQCEVIDKKTYNFLYIHRKTSPIKNEDDIIFSPDIKPQVNYRRFIDRPYDNVGRKIWNFFMTDNVYYQDNEVGEIVRSYLQFCKKSCIIKT